MQGASAAVYRFGPFEVNAQERVLRRSGIRIRLQEQPFQVLQALLDARGEIVTREQLRQHLWPEGTFVEFDHALNTAVKKIRAALCDDAAVPRYIETIPRRGYRFLAPIDTSDIPADREVDKETVVIAAVSHRRSVHPLVIAVAVAAAAFVAWALWTGLRSQAAPTVTIVILPFTHVSSGPNPLVKDFGAAVAEQMKLLHSAKLLVIARGRDRSHAPALPGAIDYVLQGSIHEDADSIHVAMQLVRMSDQNGVWAEEFEEGISADSATELANEIVHRLEPTLALLTERPR
jgi:DNA-binding winged helix-turn-helix (wHTH) protein/TolB-like protein